MQKPDVCSSVAVLHAGVRFEIHLHERFVQMATARPVFEVHTSMGMFGAGSVKPTKLFSDDGFVMHLERPMI